MKLFKSLLLSVLFIAAISFTGCNEEPTTSVTPDNTTSLSKLTLPAGAVITNATFNIFVEDATNNGHDVHQVNVDWAELIETWNIFYGKTAPQYDPTVLGSFNSVYGWQSVDITALVQGWVDGSIPNYGVLINQPLTGDGISNLRSREYNGGGVSDPYLEVTYTVGGGAPVVVQEPAFGDTFIWNNSPDNNYGSGQYVLVANLVEPYIKQALVKFDIEGTPLEECYQEETAWAANEGPLTIRYTPRGNWATYIVYNGAKEYNIYAGKNIYVGTAELNPVAGNVEIEITLEGGWELNPDEGSETVKIQGYTSTPPARNPAPGQFTTYKGANLTVTVPAFNFYGIHLDVRKAIACP
ncbi:MAG TPA: DNRLRE domain-containing protein [Ignavibacteriaceae bacterium]|nr:DNRLRE domain-containing protein [Ignavibacteriaceae bacterium]